MEGQEGSDGVNGVTRIEAGCLVGVSWERNEERVYKRMRGNKVRKDLFLWCRCIQEKARWTKVSAEVDSERCVAGARREHDLLEARSYDRVSACETLEIARVETKEYSTCIGH